MNITGSSSRTYKTLSTLLVGGACTAGISALFVIGPQVAWPADAPSAPESHSRQSGSASGSASGFSSSEEAVAKRQRTTAAKPVVLYDAPCFMARPDWPTSEVGPVPRCPRFAGK